MTKPNPEGVPAFYRDYLSNIPEAEELIPALVKHGDLTSELIKSIPEASASYRYKEGKWSVKQVVSHLVDAERIFAFRALSFARNDKTALPGFEENDYAEESNADNRTLNKIQEEFAHVRITTIDLFSSFTEEMLSRNGLCNDQVMDVNTIGYIIIGHEIHHRNILKERYFSK